MGFMKCCVMGCGDVDSSRHRFPNPKKNLERFRTWINVINNPALFQMDAQDVYTLKRVCRRHFTCNDYSTGSNRVHLNAIPSLYLSAIASAIEEPSTSGTGASEYCADTQQVVPATEKANVSGINFLATVGDNAGSNIASSSSRMELQDHFTPSINFKNSVLNKSDFTLRKSTLKGKSTPQTLLNDIGLDTRKDLTPMKRKLYGVVKKLVKSLNRTSTAKQSFRRRLFEAERFSRVKGVEDNLATLNSIASKLIRSQFREANKPKRQHRFTKEEKIIALTLYKQSPKCYRLLSKIFILPSKSTLNNFLTQINLHTGINPIIFDALKRRATTMDPADKYVAVLFDEMAIMPALHFNERTGCIEGFEDMGNGKRAHEIADHVLVFMVRGIRRNFKQPISYSFSSKGGATYVQIKEQLLQIINFLLDIDLKPITVICDQATTNCKVITSLLTETKGNCLRQGKEYKENYFEVRDFKIYPIYDPPHLLKGIRNNFLIKNISFGRGSEKKVARWENIINLYECDNGPNVFEGLRALSHLTDEHVYEKRIKKMKVKHAARIFSHRFAVTLNLASRLDNGQTLGIGAANTAELLYFFDRLFDSINGSLHKPTHGKNLRCGISNTSDHNKFWTEEALPLLATMEFEKSSGTTRKRPPSLTNWIFTIRNFREIWTVLSSAGFKYMLGRRLNQDPIENFFGQIRSHGIQYNNPSAATFVASFKTMLVNSALRLHSSSFNCEDDEGNLMFSDMQFIFTNATDFQEDEIEIDSMLAVLSENQTAALPSAPISELQQRLNVLSNTYVAGFILKKIKKQCLDCVECKNSLFLSNTSENTELITAREYGGGWEKRLCYPTVEFANAFYNIHQTVTRILDEAASSITLSNLLRHTILQNVEFSFFKCNTHKLSKIDMIIKISLQTLIHAWCKDVNRKLSGRDTRHYLGSNPVKQKAWAIGLKRNCYYKMLRSSTT